MLYTFVVIFAIVFDLACVAFVANSPHSKH